MLCSSLSLSVTVVAAVIAIVFATIIIMMTIYANAITVRAISSANAATINW
jgi:hypothetical protein